MASRKRLTPLPASVTTLVIWAKYILSSLIRLVLTMYLPESSC